MESEREKFQTVQFRAVRAADELAASIRGMQMAGMSKGDMSKVIGVNRFTLNALLTLWGLDR
jgi:DNA-binding XRE family transcriptional regulator